MFFGPWVGLGLCFEPKGLVGPGLGSTYGRFREEARPTARGPPLFSSNGSGLGLNSRPDSGPGPGLGLGFLLWAFLGSAQAHPSPAHGQDYLFPFLELLLHLSPSMPFFHLLHLSKPI